MMLNLSLTFHLFRISMRKGPKMGLSKKYFRIFATNNRLNGGTVPYSTVRLLLPKCVFLHLYGHIIYSPVPHVRTYQKSNAKGILRVLVLVPVHDTVQLYNQGGEFPLMGSLAGQGSKGGSIVRHRTVWYLY